MPSRYAAIGLCGAKNPLNVGSVLRAAGCFQASMVATSGGRYKHCATDTMSAYKQVPLIQVDDLSTVIPYECVPVAVELLPDSVSLEHYKHPNRAFYIFGPEDGTLDESVLSWCRDVVSIPAGCLNLAAAVNIVMYDRTAKMLRVDQKETD